MNRSYSKIRHIQEVNQRLENRLVENVIVEGDVNEQFPPAVSGLVKGAAKKSDNMPMMPLIISKNQLKHRNILVVRHLCRYLKMYHLL